PELHRHAPHGARRSAARLSPVPRQAGRLHQGSAEALVGAAVARAAQGIAALRGIAFGERDVLVDRSLQLFGAAAQALQLALDEIACRAERAAAGLPIHRASIARED